MYKKTFLVSTLVIFFSYSVNAKINNSLEESFFNCGHQALQLYDSLINQEVDKVTAYDYAMEFFELCENGVP